MSTNDMCYFETVKTYDLLQGSGRAVLKITTHAEEIVDASSIFLKMW
jgi:hypothetical protein